MHSSRGISFRGALVASAIALATFAISASAQTYNFRVLHVFSLSAFPDDGASPDSRVRFDSAGNLYGTTRDGGAFGSGAIFKIAKNGTETIIHSFDGEGGDAPLGPVTIDLATGDLYGTTSSGGSGCDAGCGVLYKLKADSTFTVLHRFDGVNDGSSPGGSLLLDEQGNLYGTASCGGLNIGSGNCGNGTVFRYGADGSFTILHAFTGTDSLHPSGGVIRDSVGNLYGTTSSYYTDGPSAPPSIYKLAPDGTLTTLYWFDSTNAGIPSDGLVGDQAGNLYGVTSDGSAGYDGTIFKLAADGTFTTLHAFGSFTDGIKPMGGLLLIHGNLYGTASAGGDRSCHVFGTLNGCGTVFQLSANGAYTVLHAFAQRDRGGSPFAGLTTSNGRLYGTAGASLSYVGCDNCDNYGSVYSLGVANP